MPIQAITFDFWSTLYRGQTVDYTQRLLTLKESVERGSGTTFSLEQFKAAVEIARQTWSRTWQQEHRTIDAAEWLDIILEELGTSMPDDDHFNIQTNLEESVLQEMPILEPAVKEVLAELAGRYRLGIISDTGITPGRVLRQILEQDGIIDYFDHLTFSDELGRSKPHPEAFLATLDRLQAVPAQAVHIGDLLRTDIAGAQGVKMRGVQYIGVSRDDGQDVPPAIGPVVPDGIISRHTELAPLLSQF